MRLPIIVTGLGLIVAGVVAEAAIRTVPAQYPTIQAGINAAVNDDTVLVMPGRYYENVGIRRKRITLASRYILTRDPNDILATVIDGSRPFHPDTGSCVRIYLAANTVLEGFTLVRGTGTWWLDIGDNQHYREGGGVLVELSSPAYIRNNVIAYNKAVDKSRLNTTSAGGGGIRAGFTKVILEHNVILGNEGLYGSGAVIFRAGATIRNNIVTGNYNGRVFGGAGIWIWQCLDTVRAYNNTVVTNVCEAAGGGFNCNDNEKLSLFNNIIRDNVAGHISTSQVAIESHQAILPYSNVSAGTFTGDGLINEEPQWDPLSFILPATSPSVDAGDTATMHADREDPLHPGTPLSPAGGTLRNDQGAYGGPSGGPFPVFNNPLIAVQPASWDFGRVTPGTTAIAEFTLLKRNFGLVTIDSLVIAVHNTDLIVTPAVPASVGPTIYDTSGAVTLRWAPISEYPMNDTLLVYHDANSAPQPLRIPLRGGAAFCCFGTTGNVDSDALNVTDGSDLQALVDFIFFGGRVSGCAEENDVDSDGLIDGSDLQVLVEFVFFSGPLPNCPQWEPVRQ